MTEEIIVMGGRDCASITISSKKRINIHIFVISYKEKNSKKLAVIKEKK